MNAPHPPPPAGLLPRCGAFVLDFLLLGVAVQVLHWSLFLALGGPRERLQTGPEWELFLLATVSLPCWLYFTLFEASARGATPGKRAFGLCVRDVYGGRLSRRRALLRTAVKLLPWEISHLTMSFPTPIFLTTPESEPGLRLGFLVAYALIGLWLAAAMLTRRHQSAHDLVAGTTVVPAAGLRPADQGPA